MAKYTVWQKTEQWVRYDKEADNAQQAVEQTKERGPDDEEEKEYLDEFEVWDENGVVVYPT